MSEWVKCSERLPEKDGRYLVCEKWVTGQWVGVGRFVNDKFECSMTIAWQELPEPPRG